MRVANVVSIGHLQDDDAAGAIGQQQRVVGDARTNFQPKGGLNNESEASRKSRGRKLVKQRRTLLLFERVWEELQVRRCGK